MLQGFDSKRLESNEPSSKSGVGCVFVKVGVHVVAQLDLLSDPLISVCPCLSPAKWLQRNSSVLIGRS